MNEAIDNLITDIGTEAGWLAGCQFTPGPWALFPMHGGCGWYINQQGNPGYIGRMDNVAHRAAECEANARLIAAAPSLLEACMSAFWELPCDADPEVVQQLKAAIDLATRGDSL